MTRGALALALVLGCRGVQAPRPACPAGDAHVSSQADVDALAPCTAIAGDLVIRGGGPLDLRPLAGLTRIDGDLVIGPTLALSAIDGFAALRTIGGRLRIATNAEATGAWFPALERAARVELDGNFALVGVYAPRLAAIRDALVVRDNAVLELVEIDPAAVIGAVDVARNPAWPADQQPAR
ncbi:MAG: hypothetical protein K8W52_24955 [Deltaproteobacteria bacterium]|nr:hypothetical protein [Deltaproteobacteria bacterium]